MAMTVSLFKIEIVWVFSLPLMFTFSKYGFSLGKKTPTPQQKKSLPFSFRDWEQERVCYSLLA